MSGEWITSSKFKGVSWKEHSTRKIGGKPDRYFKIRYQLLGKTKTEYLGWTSEGMTEIKAGKIIGELKEAQITGEGFLTLKEKKKAIENELLEQERLKEEEKQKNRTFDDIYINDYRKAHVIKATDSPYNKWVKPVIGNLILSEITMNHVNKIKNALLSKKMAPSSIHTTLAIIKATFKYAIENEIYEGKNVIMSLRKLKLPPVENKKTRFLNAKEQEVLLDVLCMTKKRIYDMVLLSLHTGMRRNEIYQLKWNHINFDTRIISVRDTKNKESRYLPMTDKVFIMLKNRTKKNDNYIFTNNGIGLDYDMRIFKQIVEDLGFNDGVTDRRDLFTWHNLRHTFASILVQNGVDIMVVSKLLGHKGIGMTMRYAHLCPANFEIVNKVFG